VSRVSGTHTAEAYQAALTLSGNAAEQEFLTERLRSTG
jgi:hypothetical protein